MCKGNDPLGCGKCISCETFDKLGREEHSDFTELDAASHPSVNDARQLLEDVKLEPLTGARRVVVVDEAHRLSVEAWDSYLKPLDESTDSPTGGKRTIFIFVTSDPTKIPGTIQSRCAIIGFSRVDTDVLVGLLANLCSQNKVKYELDGLRRIARLSKGHVRDAIKYLETVASTGDVTKNQVTLALDDTLEDLCTKVFLGIIRKDAAEAVKWCDEACKLHLPNMVVDTMFALYARAMFSEQGSPMEKALAALPNTSDVSSIFLKWTSVPYLSPDALALLMVELIETVGTTSSGTSSRAASKKAPIPQYGDILEHADLVKFLGVKEIKES